MPLTTPWLLPTWKHFDQSGEGKLGSKKFSILDENKDFKARARFG